MGHHRLEQRERQEPGPATEQTLDEMSSAGELREMLDELLEGEEHKSFNFKRGCFALSTGPKSSLPCRFGSLIDSPQWPDLLGTTRGPVSARVYKHHNNSYAITIESVQEYHGVYFTLQGNYPRVYEIISESSPQASAGGNRPWVRVDEPVQDHRLRPRVNRLEYGKFLVNRIKAASRGENVLP